MEEEEDQTSPTSNFKSRRRIVDVDPKFDQTIDRSVRPIDWHRSNTECRHRLRCPRINIRHIPLCPLTESTSFDTDSNSPKSVRLPSMTPIGLRDYQTL